MLVDTRASSYDVLDPPHLLAPKPMNTSTVTCGNHYNTLLYVLMNYNPNKDMTPKNNNITYQDTYSCSLCLSVSSYLFFLSIFIRIQIQFVRLYVQLICDQDQNQ